MSNGANPHEKAADPRDSAAAPQQRLSKVMARRGMCSKREADRLIAAGLVCVDGEPAPPSGQFVSEDARIEIIAEGRARLSDQRTIVLHKPARVVSNLPAPGQRQAIDLITWDSCANPGDALAQEAWQRVQGKLDSLHVAGRLDFESTGLLVLTQDGLVARTLTGEEHLVEKEYLVHVISLDRDAVSDPQLARLRRPIEDEGDLLCAERVDRLGPAKLRFVLREGKKRQIRRMCRAVDLEVVSLQRVRIGDLPLGDLAPGAWRVLAEVDVKQLCQSPRGRR